MVARYVVLTAIAASLLLMLGFWSGPWFLKYIARILSQLGIAISFVSWETAYKFSALIGVLLAACRREDFPPHTIGGKIVAIEHV